MDCETHSNKFPQSFIIIWGHMTFKGSRVMALITATLNEYAYNEILGNFLISLIEN